MADINQTLNIEGSVFGIATFGVDVFVNDVNNINDGIYYTKIFKKKSSEIWHRVAWLDNQSLETFVKIKIEVRTRTGNQLPVKNYTTGERYTLDEINNIIETQNINDIDTILERATLNRSIISDKNLLTVDSNNPNLERLGTSYNSFRINSSDDTIWNYWSLPIINSPSYIPENRDYDYLEARIALQSNDMITVPKMFRINFTSILKN